jgi:hypothetical protein
VSILLAFVLKGDTVWRRVVLVFSAFSAAFTILMTHVGLILALPRPYTLLQFSYRLEAYILFGLCAAVVATLALARTWARRWRMWSWTAIVVVIASGVGAVQQVDAYPRGDEYPGVVHPDRYFAFNPQHQPPFGGGLGDYNDATLPLVEPAGTPNGLIFPTVIHDEKVTVPVNFPGGTLVHTNLLGAPYLVSVKGAQVVGHDKSGFMVLEIDAPKGLHPQVTLSRSGRLPVALGRLVTHLALIVLALYLVAGLFWRYGRGAFGRRLERPSAVPRG